MFHRSLFNTDGIYDKSLHQRHRVEWIDPREGMIWLALQHYGVRDPDNEARL